MDNGQAKKIKTSSQIQEAGDILADPFEISMIRHDQGNDSEKPLPYSHLNIAGSSGASPGVPTAAPLLALAGCLIPKIDFPCGSEIKMNK